MFTCCMFLQTPVSLQLSIVLPYLAQQKLKACLDMYVYIYIYVCVYIYLYIYIYFILEVQKLSLFGWDHSNSPICCYNL